MKLAATLITLLPLTHSSHAMIFGVDDRLERHQLTDSKTLSYARSTAALMLKAQLEQKKISYFIDFNKPGNGPVPESGACNRAFEGQPQMTAFCSSTLIGEDLLLTAGHCIERGQGIISPQEICKQTVAVFDYAYEKHDSKNPIHHKNENVYHCKNVEFFSFTHDLDLAVIRLDRAVKNREIFKLKTEQSAPLLAGNELYLSGYPRGMPNKTVLSGSFVKAYSEFPRQNLALFYADSMGGNSGSSVLDPVTREIVGVLTESDCADTLWDEKNECFYEPTFRGQCEGVKMTLMEKTSHWIVNHGTL